MAPRFLLTFNSFGGIRPAPGRFAEVKPHTFRAPRSDGSINPRPAGSMPRGLPWGVLRSLLQEKMPMSKELEPKTSRELEQMIAEQSGLPLSIINIQKMGDAGNFTAKVIAGVKVVSGARLQSQVETICDLLRLKYRLKN
jgi:hypothetical protein